MYAGFSSGADLAETYEGFWSFDIQIVTGSGQVVASVSLTGWSQARYNSQLG